MAQDDFDELLNTVLPFAVETLGRHGEMYPFGATVGTAGETALTAAEPGVGTRPKSNDVLALLREGVTTKRDALRAAALVADVRMDRGDAIRIELEHSEGSAIVVLVPYSRKRLRRILELGDMRVQWGDRGIWGGRTT